MNNPKSKKEMTKRGRHLTQKPVSDDYFQGGQDIESKLLPKIELLRDEIEQLQKSITRLEEIESAALEAFYLNGFHKGPCMCANCLLEMVLRQNSEAYKRDQAAVKALQTKGSDNAN